MKFDLKYKDLAEYFISTIIKICNRPLFVKKRFLFRS